MNVIAATSTRIIEPLWRVRIRLAWRSFKKGWGIFRENPIGLIGLGMIAFFGLMALAHPILMATVWPPNIYDPLMGYDKEIIVHPSPPTWVPHAATEIQARRPLPPLRHILGTDPLGRDVLSQLMSSTQSEFVLGIMAALITVIVETTLGAVTAYYGGVIDMIFMRIADLMIMLPFIPLMIVLGSMFDFQMMQLALVYGILVGFGGNTLVIKSQALTLKVKAYIEAARVAGGNDFHIIFTHLIPNLLPLSFLSMMITVTGAIFVEAVLSFFGLINIRMSWGIMIQITQAAGYLLTSWKYWYLMFPAGLSISLLCSAFYLVGRAMDAVVNPRLRKR
ncbi:MAG TPA: ABC transporter permease [Anaerolineae bacterium]|nr:ABC transporter permease [Anaerolineae bacterium]HQI86776.1 ABC transporter permease [Anaerolineae bacterium]